MKQRVKSRLIVWTWGPLIACAAVALAQDKPDNPQLEQPEAESRSKESPADGPSVRVVGPDTYLLRDPDGNYIKVPDFSFDDFRRLYNIGQGLAQPIQPPRYAVSLVDIQGAVHLDVANLTVKLRLSVHHNEWVAIPVGLHDSVIRNPVRYDGTGEYFVHFEEEGAGHVIWLHGSQEEPHEFQLDLFVPVTRVGENSRLELTLPRATSSQLQLEVPGTGTDAKAADQATRIETQQTEGGGTQLKATALGRWLRLSWRDGQSTGTRQPVVLKVTGTVLTKIEEPTRITSEARLLVRSFGGDVDRLRVRLPPGATWIPQTHAAYVVVPLDSNGVGSDEEPEIRTEIVEVIFPEETSSPPEIQLATELLRESAAPDENIEIAGFDVQGAARQSGQVGLAATGKYYPIWKVGRHVQRVNQLPTILADEPIVASFEYFRQPYSLKVQVLPRTSRINVEPLYQLQVAPEQVNLTAQLSYSIRGAETSFISVDLSGWTIDEVVPQSLIKANEMVTERVQPLIIPLKKAQTGKLEIKIHAHRKLAGSEKSLTIRLPRPAATTLSPAVVAVIPDDNVKLTERPDDIIGLVAVPMRPAIDLPVRQQEPFYYRAPTDSPDPVFAADFVVALQSIDVDVQSQVVLNENGARVDQRFTYTIAHEPLDRVELLVPKRIADSAETKLFVGEEQLALIPIHQVQDGAEQDGVVAMQAVLPIPQIGPCELRASYPLTWRTDTEKQPIPISIPLIMPVKGTITNNTVRLDVSAVQGFEVLDSNWNRNANSANDSMPGQVIYFSNAEAASQFPLSVTRTPLSRPDSTEIEQAWLQTWLSPTRRQERVTFQLSTEDESVRVVMPDGVPHADIRARIDGQIVIPKASRRIESRPLIVEIPIQSHKELHLLEMWYPFHAGRPACGSMQIEVPTIQGAVWTRFAFWQLITPRDEHLILGPRNWQREFEWNWKGLLWTQPTAYTEQLEQQLGASWNSTLNNSSTAASTNQYLFSSFAPLAQFELRTVNRRDIILVVSGTVLVVGLLLMYLPALRHPSGLLVISILILCAGLLYPEPAMLVAQAAGLGLALTIAGNMIRWILIQQKQGVEVIRSSSISAVETMSSSVIDRFASGSERATAVSPPQEAQEEVEP